MASYLALRPHLHNVVHNSLIAADDARGWGLARSGHHPCSDGRSARHASQCGSACPLSGALDGTLMHLLVLCPGVLDLRNGWLHQVGLHEHQLNAPFAALCGQLFDPTNTINTPASTAAHVRFVAACCRRFRRGLSGELSCPEF